MRSTTTIVTPWGHTVEITSGYTHEDAAVIHVRSTGHASLSYGNARAIIAALDSLCPDRRKAERRAHVSGK